MTVEAVRAAREPTSYFTPAMAFPRVRAVVRQPSETDNDLEFHDRRNPRVGPSVVALAAIGFAFYQQGRGMSPATGFWPRLRRQLGRACREPQSGSPRF